MKKVALIIGGILLALIILLVVGRKVAVGYLTPDFLVQQIESRWKCRAHIDSVDVRILGNATIELKGFAIGKRDVHARKKTPLADRPPLEKAELSSDHVLLEVRPWPLISRRLDIRHLELEGAYVETAIRRTGKLSIERLFDEPGFGSENKADPTGETGDSTLGATEGDLDAAPPGTDSNRGSEAPGIEDSVATLEEEKFNAGNLPVAMAADRVEVRDGSIALRIDASGARIALDNLQITLTEIDVNPDDLVSHNRLAFVLESDLVVQPREGDSEFVNANLAGAGTMRPFDPISGEVNPVIHSDVTVHQGTRLETFPLVEKVGELLEKAETAGIAFGEFTLDGELQADAKTRIVYEQPRLRLEAPLTIELPETTLIMNPDSWMDTGTNEHHMEGIIKASEELTERVEGMVDAYLKDKAGAFASEGLRDTILNPLKDADGRVAVEVVSEGDLGDPQADIITPLGNLTEVIDTGKKLKDSLEEVGKSFLKGLLGGDEEPDKP